MMNWHSILPRVKIENSTKKIAPISNKFYDNLFEKRYFYGEISKDSEDDLQKRWLLNRLQVFMNVRTL